jgi:hypothetical protein
MTSINIFNYEDMQLMFEPIDLMHMTQIKLCNDEVNVKILEHEDMQLIFNKESELTFTKNGPSMYVDRNFMTRKIEEARAADKEVIRDGIRTYSLRLDTVLEEIYSKLNPVVD